MTDAQQPNPAPAEPREFEIARLQLRAEDRLLVRIKHPLTVGESRRIEAYFRDRLAIDARICVVDEHLDVSVVSPPSAFQERVGAWMLACFGEAIAADRLERNHRFLEEALELVQACGCTAAEAHRLVTYVFGRPPGDPGQEVGGVMATLAAHCRAHGIDMEAAGETELARIWTKVDQIRAKQAAKPKHSPLPEGTPGETDYERGQRDMLNAILSLNPAISAKLAAFHEREPDPEGRIPFDVALWVSEVAAQHGIEPREVADV